MGRTIGTGPYCPKGDQSSVQKGPHRGLRHETIQAAADALDCVSTPRPYPNC